MHLLDNPVWHALTGPQATVAQGSSLASRYERDVSPFCALPDVPTPAAWDALCRLVRPGRAALLFRATVAVPDGWTELLRIPTVQMVAERVDHDTPLVVEPLTEPDVPDMLALVERTEPGPFAARTIEMGEYVGVRDHGVLVAMAGERMRLPGYTEISAVCTAPAHRGRGLATGLVRALVGRIRARGETPILHATKDNVNAIRLYAALGFVLRREVEVVAARAPGERHGKR